jgi:hypothetical protein
MVGQMDEKMVDMMVVLMVVMSVGWSAMMLVDEMDALKEWMMERW